MIITVKKSNESIKQQVKCNEDAAGQPGGAGLNLHIVIENYNNNIGPSGNN